MADSVIQSQGLSDFVGTVQDNDPEVDDRFSYTIPKALPKYSYEIQTLTPQTAVGYGQEARIVLNTYGHLSALRNIVVRPTITMTAGAGAAAANPNAYRPERGWHYFESFQIRDGAKTIFEMSSHALEEVLLRTSSKEEWDAVEAAAQTGAFSVTADEADSATVNFPLRFESLFDNPRQMLDLRRSQNRLSLVLKWRTYASNFGPDAGALTVTPSVEVDAHYVSLPESVDNKFVEAAYGNSENALTTVCKSYVSENDHVMTGNATTTTVQLRNTPRVVQAISFCAIDDGQGRPLEGYENLSGATITLNLQNKQYVVGMEALQVALAGSNWSMWNADRNIFIYTIPLSIFASSTEFTGGPSWRHLNQASLTISGMESDTYTVRCWYHTYVLARQNGLSGGVTIVSDA